MANELAATFTLTGDLTLTKANDVAAIATSFSIGSNDWPEVTHEFEDGTADGKANEIYLAQLTIAAGATTSIDLSGTTYDNPFGEDLALTAVRAIVVTVEEPSSSKVVRVGPQNVANAAQLWFGGTGATCYEEVYNSVFRFRSTGGWTVTAGTGDLLPINNPGASSVVVNVLVIGTK